MAEARLLREYTFLDEEERGRQRRRTSPREREVNFADDPVGTVGEQVRAHTEERGGSPVRVSRRTTSEGKGTGSGETGSWDGAQAAATSGNSNKANPGVSATGSINR